MQQIYLMNIDVQLHNVFVREYHHLRLPYCGWWKAQTFWHGWKYWLVMNCVPQLGELTYLYETWQHVEIYRYWKFFQLRVFMFSVQLWTDCFGAGHIQASGLVRTEVFSLCRNSHYEDYIGIPIMQTAGCFDCTISSMKFLILNDSWCTCELTRYMLNSLTET